MASKTELSDGNVAGVPPTTEVSLAGIGGPLAGPFHPDSELDDQTYDVITEFVQADPVNECVPLRLPLCSGSMPWSITAFPNIVNNNNMNQLQESLNYFQSILVGSRCSSRATEYTCAILEPACGPDAIPLPPCRNFCQDIVRTCSEFFVEGNAHNAAFLCDEFPDSENPNVCVDIRRASSDILDAHSTDISDQSPLENPNEPQEVTENPPSGDDFLVDQQSPSNKSVTEKNVDEAIPMTVDSQDKPIDTNLTARTEPPMNKNSTSDPKETASEDTEVETSDMTEPSVFICDHTKFLCTDGSDCLGDESVCDGIQHCLDNSDELNCTKPEVNTPVDLIGEDSQPETTTYFSFALEENNAQDDRLEDLPSRRPSSLSEILSGSALVAVPNQQPPPIPPSSPKQNRIRVPAPRTLMKGKEQDPSQPFERNAFPSFGPFPFTVKPPTSEKIERPQPSSKLSLAALLSSSSITPVSPPRGNGPQDESPITDFGQEEISPPSQRSLSSLLSSNLPSFSSFPLRRSAQNECREFECNDSSCILLSQVGDGFRDCPDGADENKNIIS